MKVLQYYYTSYIQPKKRRAGFQVKAMSPEIDATLQALIARLIAYCIPASCDASALATHPIALRYYRTESGTDILLCSQSSGKDEYGRPGNFFAHVVILEAHRFTSIPPIFFWKSSFWRKSDVEEREEITSLPVLSSFEGETALSMKDVWSFLDHAHRRSLLHKLLCAVISSRKMQQRIVIFDTDEHVALWIAAVSCFFPPEYRPFVTFTTYHHDPRQAQYLITGTSKSTSSLATLSNSCFILDAEMGQTSPIETSLYAELAVQAAWPDIYETGLLPLFQISQQRFPQPTTIDESLNSVALMSGSMSPELAWQVSCYLEGCEIQEYTALLEHSIPLFLQQDISQQTHTELIQALFPHSIRLGITSYFWKVYLQTFSSLLANQSSEHLALTLLDFWFSTSPHAFIRGYPVQQFFLLLPTCSRIARKLAANDFNQASWSAALQVIFTRPPAFFTAVSSTMVNWMQQYIVEEEQRKERAREKQILKTAISLLFEREMVVERHCKLAELYSLVSAEQFWSLYWQQFLQLFTSDNVDEILTVLSFWFDQSYTVREPAFTLPQEFFLGLSRVLQRERSTRKVIEALHEKIVQEELPYYWFSSLQICVEGRSNE